MNAPIAKLNVPADDTTQPLASGVSLTDAPSPAGVREGEPGTPEPISLDEAADEGWEDDILPLSHPVMQRAMADYARLTDSRLAEHSKDQRKYERGEKR